MESSLKLTPIKLVQLADEECQVLKHLGQWVETIEPSIVAMQALLQTTAQGTNKIFEQLTVNSSKISNYSTSQNNNQGWCRDTPPGNYQWSQEDQNKRYGSNSPEWVYDKPTDLQETCTHRGGIWSFCPKCGHNGKWVCTHTSATHWSSAFINRKNV